MVLFYHISSLYDSADLIRSSLDSCGESREALSQQQAELYTKLADLNWELRQVRKQIKMCGEIQEQAAAMQENIRQIEPPEKEVKNYDKQR